MMQQTGNMMPIDIVGGTNPARYKKISAEASYNMVVSDDSLVPYSGYEQVLNLGANPRAEYRSTLSNRLLIAVGNQIQVISPGLGVATVGLLSTFEGNVYFAENGNSQVGISDLNNYYVYNYNTETFGIQDIGFIPSFLTAQGGYIFGTLPGTNQFRYSNVNDAIMWDARNGGSIGNDLILAITALGELIYVQGSKFTKIWRNLGQAVNPFRLDSSVNILYGTVNANSVAPGNGIIVWVATNEDSNATILMSSGASEQVISTDGIDYLLSNLTKPTDCSGFIYLQDGHLFYQVTFRTDNLTLVYDFTSKKFLYATDEKGNAHIANQLEHFNDKYYFISAVDNYLYQMNTNITTYNGEIIPRIRVTRPFRLPNYKFFTLKKLEVICETGFTNLPMYIDLTISTNGGATFGAPVRKQLAALGNSRYVVRWFQLGWGNDWTFQFRFYGPERFVILGAYGEVKT